MKNKSRFQITFDVYPHVFRRLPENGGEKAKSIVRIHHKCLSLSKSSKIGCISEEQRKSFFSLVFLSIWINFSRSRMRIYLYSLRLIEILHYLCTHKQTTDQNMKQRLFLSLALSLCMASMLANGIYYVKDFGAKGDGKALDHIAINKAIEAATNAGGGQVVLSPGTYLCGSIRLKSNVDLHLMAGAKILAAPGEMKVYDER
jgi:polygalacturonase